MTLFAEQVKKADALADLDDLITVTDHPEVRKKLKEARAVMNDPAYDLIVAVRRMIAAVDELLYNHTIALDGGLRGEGAPIKERSPITDEMVAPAQWMREQQSVLLKALVAYEDRKG